MLLNLQLRLEPPPAAPSVPLHGSFPPYVQTPLTSASISFTRPVHLIVPCVHRAAIQSVDDTSSRRIKSSCLSPTHIQYSAHILTTLPIRKISHCSLNVHLSAKSQCRTYCSLSVFPNSGTLVYEGLFLLRRWGSHRHLIPRLTRLPLQHVNAPHCSPLPIFLLS